MVFSLYLYNMKKEITLQRINNYIMAILRSPNQGVERAALWTRLHNLKASISC